MDLMTELSPIFSAEDLTRIFSSMDDVVRSINNRVDYGPLPGQTSQESYDVVYNNWTTLSGLLARPDIQEFGRDLTPYENAIAKGQAFAPSPE